MNINITKQQTKKYLEALKQHTHNKHCADCLKPSPIWVSLNFGIFICAECAGRHRELGVTVSKVKSTILDDWNLNELRRIGVAGNKYAHMLPDLPFKEKYLKSKYHEKFIDNLVAKDEEERPGDSFLNEIEKKKTNTSFANEIPIKSIPIRKLGEKKKTDRKEPIKTKFIEKEKGDKKEEVTVSKERSFILKTNNKPSLKKASDKAFVLNETQIERVGLGSIKINVEENNEKYSYRNLRVCERVKPSEESILDKVKNSGKNLINGFFNNEK
ncbi:ADP-ribosylation factor GTPase-activating protein AGD5 [Astathelohania contejeani]|uniref:ADP-ribosylation factor GTPase-activating protein AGD5 n=1 Tax=Astathelohania contejeani TaxID=164912 RepID=A0ABQ7I1G1_9MICR|nr:ADP-ribosylation factor GTPase-activating protein AGD5 [Thelohania contejeani]